MKSHIRFMLANDQEWLEAGILAIDARQTEDEKRDGVTRYDNDRGWNATDAKLGSYLAKYIRRCRRPNGQRLTGNWVSRGRRMMRKYAGQLARIAAARKVAMAA